MLIVRSLISLLIVTIVVLSGFGLVWWNEPPAQLAHYENGGKVILGLLILASLVGLGRLWTPPKEHDVCA